MKKPIAYFFIVVYSVLLLRPAMPFVADALAHAFWYSQHIATVHFENGKYHVHYQWLDESGKSLAGKNNQSLKTEIFMGDWLVTSITFEFLIDLVQKDSYPDESFDLRSVFSRLNYPPPPKA